jgi:teichuronic acid biosynthesis glycosyltransferase TuaC
MTTVAWVTPGYPWVEQPVGGGFYRTQAEALARLGHEVRVICPTPWAPWPLPRLREQWRAYANAPQISTEHDVTVLRPRYPNVPGQPDWAQPDKLIARAIWKARVDWGGARLVHGHSAVESLAAWRVARRASLPLVLTFHGSDMNTWPDVHANRLDDIRRAVRDAAAVIAVSSALATRIASLTGVAAQHLPIGSNLRGLAQAAVPRGDARRGVGLPDERIVVLYVGNLLQAKGVRELADAILRLGDPYLGVFVGRGPEAGYGTSATTGASPSRLEYVGERPHAEVVRYMSAADVLVLPSHSEGLPTVLVEAGALGLPVIASYVGGIPELLRPDRGVILPDTSVDAIVASLRAFVADRARSTDAARRLRDHVVQAYDVDRNTSKLVELYEAAIEGRTRP